MLTYLKECGEPGRRKRLYCWQKVCFAPNRSTAIFHVNRAVFAAELITETIPMSMWLNRTELLSRRIKLKCCRRNFQKPAWNQNRKVYIIHHADLMTVNAANSLLKFLEEPDSHTTAILITEQIQQILPTILSRCQVVSFKPLSFEKLVEQLIASGVNPKKAPLIAKMTNNIDEGLALNEDEWFAVAQKLVVKLYEALEKSPLEALSALQENWFAHFTEKDRHDKGLELLLLLLRDLLYIQLGKKEQIVFLHEKKRLEQMALHSSGLRLANQMASVMDAKENCMPI